MILFCVDSIEILGAVCAGAVFDDYAIMTEPTPVFRVPALFFDC